GGRGAGLRVRLDVRVEVVEVLERPVLPVDAAEGEYEVVGGARGLGRWHLDESAVLRVEQVLPRRRYHRAARLEYVSPDADGLRVGVDGVPEARVVLELGGEGVRASGDIRLGKSPVFGDDVVLAGRAEPDVGLRAAALGLDARQRRSRRQE